MYNISNHVKYSHMYNTYIKVGNIYIYIYIYISTFFLLFYQRDKGSKYGITYLKCK